MLKSLLIFLLAALFEVGGGYLVWIWLKEGKSLFIGLFGMLCLCIYGIIATFQIEGFGRVYAAYGGIFVVFSIIWAMLLDGFSPDRWDIIGAFVILAGVFLMYMPR